MENSKKSLFDLLPTELVEKTMMFVPEKDITTLEDRFSVCKEIACRESFWINRIEHELSTSRTKEHVFTARQRYKEILSIKSTFSFVFARYIIDMEKFVLHLLNNESQECSSFFLMFKNHGRWSHGPALHWYDIPRNDADERLEYISPGIMYDHLSKNFVSLNSVFFHRKDSMVFMFYEADIQSLADHETILERFEKLSLVSGPVLTLKDPQDIYLSLLNVNVCITKHKIFEQIHY
jgi:hypothetical protein